MTYARLILTVLLAAPPALANAQRAPGTAELTGSYHHLTAGYGNGSGQALRVILPGGPDVWFLDAAREQRFGEDGFVGAVANTHTFSDRYYTHAGMSASSRGAIFLPRYRLDVQLARKWGAAGRLVSTAGIGHYAAHDEHRDVALSAGVLYYFPAGTVAEAGVTLNRSNPGEVFAARQYAAVTHGRARSYYVSGRIGFGREAYQIVGPASTLSSFTSHEIQLRVRRWLLPDAGIALTGERYGNPSYARTGVYVTLFKEFTR